MPVYPELHWYDSGFRARLAMPRARPAFLPPPHSVGLRSHEGELQQGDYAIELAPFHLEERALVWLGCYTKGIDLTFGDRGVYWGTGLWLSEIALLHSHKTIGLLREATARLVQARGPSPELMDDLARFGTEFAELGWAISGRPTLPAAAGARQSHYFSIGNASDRAFQLAATDILRQFLQPQDNARRLYFLTKHSRIEVPRLQRLDSPEFAAFARWLSRSGDAAPMPPASSVYGSMR